MSNLTDDDIERLADALAPRLVSSVQSSNHDFWIDRETHYQDHQDFRVLKEALHAEAIYDLKQIITLFKTTRSLWFKAFLGAAAVGAIIAAGVGMGLHR